MQEDERRDQSAGISKILLEYIQICWVFLFCYKRYDQKVERNQKEEQQLIELGTFCLDEVDGEERSSF